ncbi:MAG: SDR family oxidoreductase, partial [Gammaproteobacteria bacterium]
MNFTDRQVILTGATGGIGRAVAQQLAERGARVIAIGRHQQTLRDLEHQLPKPATDHHVFFSADITDSSERLRVFKTLHQQQLRPNCLITLAGVNDFAMFKDQAADTIQNIIDLNVSASLCTTQMAIPLIRHEKNPLIVHVGAVFGALGYPGQSVYCASKYALRGFSEALRRELSDTPITVKYFAPRATQTAFNSSSMRQLNHTLGNTVDAPETV